MIKVILTQFLLDPEKAANRAALIAYKECQLLPLPIG